MYQIGECVVKANIGLCRIADILHPEWSSEDKKKLYYLLIPFSDEKMNVYVPVDRVSDTIRRALDSEKAWKIIEEIPLIDEVRIENEKMREQKYKEALKSCRPESLISIIKTMYIRKQKRNEQGKKSTTMDDRYFRIAEDYLYSELAYAIGRDKNEIIGLIEEAIRKKDADKNPVTEGNRKFS